MKPAVAVLGLLAIALGASTRADQVAREAILFGGVEAGLAVHLGTTDGALESELTNGGRMLVHGLALSESQCRAARKTIMADGLYGLASVATWHDRSRLPYATNLVNLLIADLDALGSVAPPQAEMERVVAPEGVLLLRKGGKWEKIVKTRPEGMDHWGHFDHDAMGRGTSRDVLVDPVRQQQWLTGLQPIPEEGNPAGYDPGGGIRISGRYVIADVNDGYTAEPDAKKPDTWVLQGRDAFNGTPLWTLRRGRETSQSRWSLVAADGVAYAWLKRDGELTAIDLATGEKLRSYADTADPEALAAGEAVCVRVEGDTLVVGMRDRILCFEVISGKLRWSFARTGVHAVAPVLDAARGRVYCVLVKPGAKLTFRGRWPASRNVQAVLALDLATGHLVWECEEVASVEVKAGKKGLEIRGIGQLIPGERHLVVFGSKAISGGDSPYIGAIDLQSGALVHGNDAPFESNYNVASYNVLWRDGAAYFAGAFTNLWRYDPGSGEVTRVLSSSWNQRCTRFAATPRWFLFGQAAFYSPDFSGEQVSVGRSGCALPNTPANGMTYFTPTMCGCTTLVPGFQAMTGEEAPVPVADTLRLVRGDPQDRVLVISSKTELPAGPIAADWTKQLRAGEIETEAVTMGDLELVAISHQHRLEARRDGKAVWTFAANARISAPPVIHGETAIFGAHDGWVYAIGSDGRLRWKYFLAPSERLIGINAQLESAWPVYGVALLGDQVIASAGTHVELGGGVTVAALDAVNGEPAWIKRLQKHPSVVPPGGKDARIVAHSFINSVPRIADGSIVLGDGGRRGGSFLFAPDDEEAALNARLNTFVKKK